MGTNKRYATAIDARIDGRILERISRDGPLQSLTTEELELEQRPLTVDPQPRRRIRAWVRFGNTPVKVDAIACRWTTQACGIEFTAAGSTHRCWVWAGAIEEIDE